jgi:hypothetical protein
VKLRLQSAMAEMIWQGRVQIGDEPGVYSDANYCGLATELPVTLSEYSSGGGVDVTFEIMAEGASNFGAPYPGHKITIFALKQKPGSNPPVWEKTDVGGGVLVSDTTVVQANIASGTRHVSVRVEADWTVTPGYYDDFVLTGLSMRSTSHYADFGFRA